jgi:hypothetical protein
VAALRSDSTAEIWPTSFVLDAGGDVTAGSAPAGVLAEVAPAAGANCDPRREPAVVAV